ncbi:MAG TPA: hypothetical protein VN456_04945 [Desulfosporosinus sp.]|nr:hypothetical protein [Desulfosporosinus sp.]
MLAKLTHLNRGVIPEVRRLFAVHGTIDISPSVDKSHGAPLRFANGTRHAPPLNGSLCNVIAFARLGYVEEEIHVSMLSKLIFLTV